MDNYYSSTQSFTVIISYSTLARQLGEENFISDIKIQLTLIVEGEAGRFGGEGGREEEKEDRDRIEPHLDPIWESRGEPGGV